MRQPKRPGKGAPWIRLPTYIARDLIEGERSTDAQAFARLLLCWHEDYDIGPNEFMRRCGWGKGRTLRFMLDVAAWAVENGAAVPASWVDRVADRSRDRLRTGSGEEQPAQSEASGPVADHFRTDSRARDLSSGGEEREIEIMGGESDAATATSPVDLPAALDGDGRLLAPLLSAGLVTVEQVEAQTIQALRMLPGVGAKRALAIADALARHGHPLRTEAPPKRTREVERPGLRDLSDRWCAAYERVTGSPYRWTQGGPTSDAKAIATIYDAVGWTDPPTAEVASATRATVIGYLQARQRRGWVPTLADLARNLAEFRQAPELVAAASEPLRFRSSDEARSDAKMALIHSLLTPATTRITDDA